MLGLTQQSVSGKMRGKIAVTVRDMEKLAEKYGVPTAYFLMPEHIGPHLAKGMMSDRETPERTALMTQILRLPIHLKGKAFAYIMGLEAGSKP